MAFFDSKFDHAKHGSFDTPEAVVKSDALSDSEKQSVLEEWSSSIKHILTNDPNHTEANQTKRSLDDAAERLAAAKT